MAADFDLHPLRFHPKFGIRAPSLPLRPHPFHRVRTPEEYELLAEHADSVAIFEFQGDLFFGSTERLFRSVVDDIAGVEAVVLDCKRMGNLDGAALSMLSSLRVALDDVGCVLVMAEAPTGCSKTSRRAPSATPTRRSSGVRTASSPSTGPPPSHCPRSSGSRSSSVGSPPRSWRWWSGSRSCSRFLPARSCSARATTDAIYFVLSGLVSVRLPLVGEGRDHRLATLGPGVAVGEMAFLDEGRRSADVVAERDSTLARLSIDDLREIGRTAPQVTAAFSANLARNLSGRLRRANEQVRMLAH